MTSEYDYLIIGGGIAGITAAETVRENDSDATIAILCDEAYPLYSRVLLPSYLKNRIPRQKLFLRTVEDFTEKRMDLRLEERVLSLDPEAHTVQLDNHSTLSYKKLLIASGGRVIKWGNPEEARFLYRLQTLEDADRLFQNIGGIAHPIILGSSFIALEFLEIFVVHKITPTLIFRDSHYFSSLLDTVGGEFMKNNLEAHGVRIISGDSIDKISTHENILEVDTLMKRKIECDALAVGIGIDRNVEFIEGSGIELGKKGIRTNEFFETNKVDVYAAGDVAEFFDLSHGIHRSVGNWTNAFLHGKQAGFNMMGKRHPFQNVSGYSITNLGLQFTALGDCTQNDDTIVRVYRAGHTLHYERLFLKGGALAGAVLINQFQDKPHLTALIETKTPLEGYREKLQDSAFDVRTIEVVN